MCKFSDFSVNDNSNDDNNNNKEIYFWESTVVKFSYLIHYDTLLQNVPNIITKSNSYFITKCNKHLLQNVSNFVLQNSAIITKGDVY